MPVLTAPLFCFTATGTIGKDWMIRRRCGQCEFVRKPISKKPPTPAQVAWRAEYAAALEDYGKTIRSNWDRRAWHRVPTLAKYPWSDWNMYLELSLDARAADPLAVVHGIGWEIIEYRTTTLIRFRFQYFDSSGTFRLRWGPAPDDMPNILTPSSTSPYLKFQVTGLSPGQTIYAQAYDIAAHHLGLCGIYDATTKTS